MEKYGWKAQIKINLTLLRIMGLWPSRDNTYQPGCYLVYSFVMISFFVIGHILFQVINVYFIANDLKSLMATSYLLLLEILGGLKAYYLIKNMKILKTQINKFDSDWFQPKNSYQKKLIEPRIYFWKAVYNIFLSMAIPCNLFWALYPLLDEAEERRLPFLGWYPYNYRKSPYYEFTYLYQVVAICYLTTVHTNVDTLISAFNVYTACHFEILTDDLRKFVDGNSDVRGNMIDCIEHHKNILSFIANSAIFCNWILLLQLFISAVSIGITMFQLTVVEPLSNEFYSLVSYANAITTEIFMYCWFGNEVEVTSSKILYAVFESDWTDLSEEIKKELLFFTLHLKPVRISALNLFYLSLETFMKILKTAWSYFALLSQVSAA